MRNTRARNLKASESIRIMKLEMIKKDTYLKYLILF